MLNKRLTLNLLKRVKNYFTVKVVMSIIDNNIWQLDYQIDVSRNAELINDVKIKQWNKYYSILDLDKQPKVVK